jgi:hypothetical protein
MGKDESKIIKYSLLPINQLWHDQNEWTEINIETRPKDLFLEAPMLWLSPKIDEPIARSL